MSNKKSFVDPEPKMPWEVPHQYGMVDIDNPVEETHLLVSKTLNDKNTQLNQIEGNVDDKLNKSIKDFIEELKANENPTAKEKASIVERELIFLSRYFTVDTSRILIKKLPDGVVGEEKGGYQYLDPCLFSNKAFNEEAFFDIREQTLAHELTHSKFNLDNEGLTEKYARMITGTDIKNYENEVYNVSLVTDIIGGGNKEEGVLRTIELYTAERYDDLFEEFETAYSAKHPEKVAENPDVALKIFQLAFPSLKVAKDGELKVDEDLINELSQ